MSPPRPLHLLMLLVLLMTDGVQAGCDWTNCRTSLGSCPDAGFGPDSYSTGRTTRSALAWDWDFCGIAWERKYECCNSPRPTKYPTNTPKPTAFPTAFPTVFPTDLPTQFPTGSPTTPKPTLNPTPSPTPPTPFPSRAPTVGVPSAAPTAPLDLCSESDLAAFASNKRHFDRDLTTCGVYCSLDVLRDPEEVITCMQKCHSEEDPDRRRATLRMPPFDVPCAFCFGSYAECMLSACDCWAGRPMSERCTECSLNTCEATFGNCTGGMVPDAYTDGYPVPQTTDDSLMTAALGTFGGLVFLSGAAGVYMYRQRATRDPGRASSLRLSTFLGKSPITSKVVSESNPLFGIGGGELPAAAAAAATAAAVAATVAAAAIASAGDKLTVVHAFEGNPEFDDELTVAKGDELEFVELVGNDNEWMSCVDPRTGKEGILPTVNVKFNVQT